MLPAPVRKDLAPITSRNQWGTRLPGFMVIKRVYTCNCDREQDAWQTNTTRGSEWLMNQLRLLQRVKRSLFTVKTKQDTQSLDIQLLDNNLFSARDTDSIETGMTTPQFTKETIRDNENLARIINNLARQPKKVLPIGNWLINDTNKNICVKQLCSATTLIVWMEKQSP